MKARNKDQTKKEIIDSVTTILEREGFSGIGINAISKESGYDKVLIYRYFGGLEGLLETYIEQQDFYLNIDKIVDQPWDNLSSSEVRRISKKILLSHLRILHSNKPLQEIMIWELVEKNKILDKVSEARESAGYQITQHLMAKLSSDKFDFESIIALLVSAINYIVLRSKTLQTFNGVDLTSEDGWDRIEKSVEVLLDLLFDQAEFT